MNDIEYIAKQAFDSLLERLEKMSATEAERYDVMFALFNRVMSELLPEGVCLADKQENAS